MSTPGRYADGNGLYLVVDSSGAKRWMQRLIVQGKHRDLGLGSVSLVSLDDARELAFKNRRRARSGGNPLDDKKKATGDSISLKDAALAVHALNNGTWKSKKHAKQWFSSLESHVFPKIGHISISQISSADVMSVLSSIWISKHETARRVVQRIRSIIKWARAQGYHSGDDPVEIALAALPKNSAKPQHHDSLPPSLALCSSHHASGNDHSCGCRHAGTRHQSGFWQDMCSSGVYWCMKNCLFCHHATTVTNFDASVSLGKAVWERPIFR